MTTTTPRRAFTLIELIVTMIILGIILALLAINVIGPVMASTRAKRAESTLTQVQTVEQLFARDWGTYSAWRADLNGLVSSLVIRNGSVSRGPTEVSVAVGTSGTLAMAVAVDSSTCVFRRVAPLWQGGGSDDPGVAATAQCVAAAALPMGESTVIQSATMKTPY